MSGHTRAPWFAGRALRGGQECIVGDGDSVVCFMPDRTIGCTFVRDDALLIAAAPDLLEALKRLTELAIGPAGGVTQADKREAIANASAAIAAATGETK